MEALLLVFGYEGAELKKLKALCREKSIRMKNVDEAEAGQKLGALCSLREREEAASGEAPGQMLVFARFGDRQLDMLLAAIRTARLGADAVKAVLTPDNAAWRACDLYRELIKERNELEK